MLWIILKDASHAIISCNLHEEKGTHQLWVTRVGGKSLKIAESKERAHVQEIRDAIDYAVSEGHKVLDLA